MGSQGEQLIASTKFVLVNSSVVCFFTSRYFKESSRDLLKRLQRRAKALKSGEGFCHSQEVVGLRHYICYWSCVINGLLLCSFHKFLL